MKKYTLLTILSSIIIASCGGIEGGSGGSLSPKAAPKTFNLKGQAVDGLLISAKVNIYSLNSSGEKLELLNAIPVNTDPSGNFRIDNIVDTPQAILIEVCGGDYREEALGKNRYLAPTECLTSYDYIQKNGQDRHYTVSGLTHMASAYTRNLLKTKKNLHYAIDEGRRALESMIGFDTHSVVFKDVTSNEFKDFAFASNPYGFTYSLLIAGVSKFVTSLGTEIATYSSINYWRLLHDDILNDGYIDGVGTNGPVKLGNTVLHPNQLRTQATRLANQFFLEGTSLSTKWLKSKLARNQADKDRVLIALRKINNGNHSIYRDITPTAMDNQAPIPQWDTAYFDGAFTLSTYTITFTEDNALASVIVAITDKSGHYDKIFSVQGESVLKTYIKAGNTLHFSVNPKKYLTGSAVLSITMADEYNNSHTTTRTLYFVNDKPAITFSTNTKKISKGLVNIKGTYTMPTKEVGIKSIVFNWVEGIQKRSKEATINQANSTWAISITPRATGVGGIVEFEVVACDTINNCHTQSYTVKIDNKPPLISIEGSNTQPLKAWLPSDKKVTTAHGQIIRTLKDWAYPRISIATNPIIFYYLYGTNSQGEVALTTTELDKAKIPYVTFAFADDLNSRSYNTPLAKMKVSVEYSTAVLNERTYLNYPQTPNLTLNKIFKKDIPIGESPILTNGTRALIYPFTTEYLGQQFKNTNPNTSHILQFTVCDEAENCTKTAYNFQAMFEPPKAENLEFNDAKTPTITRGKISNPFTRLTLLMGAQLELLESPLTNNESKAIYIKPKISSQQFTFEIIERRRNAINRWEKRINTPHCTNERFHLTYVSDRILVRPTSPANEGASRYNCRGSRESTCRGVKGGGGGGGDPYTYPCTVHFDRFYTYSRISYHYTGTNSTYSTTTRKVAITERDFIVNSGNGSIFSNDGYFKILPQSRVKITTRILLNTGFTLNNPLALSTKIVDSVASGLSIHDVGASISYTPKTTIKLIFADGTNTRPNIQPAILTAEGDKVDYTEMRQ